MTTAEERKGQLREQQRAALRRLSEITTLTPTGLAREADLAPSTLNRFLNEEVKHALSANTMLAVEDAALLYVQKNYIEIPVLESGMMLESAEARRQWLIDEVTKVFNRLRSDTSAARRATEESERSDTKLRRDQAEVSERRTESGFQSEDLPVVGESRGGADGFFFNNGTVRAYVPRPANLLKVHNAYSVYVNGSSMEPRYFHGELVYVNPNKPPKSGDFVVIELKDGQGLIKRLKRRAAKRWTFEQFQPAKDLTFEDAEVAAVHLIVGSLSI